MSNNQTPEVGSTGREGPVPGGSHDPLTLDDIRDVVTGFYGLAGEDNTAEKRLARIALLLGVPVAGLPSPPVSTGAPPFTGTCSLVVPNFDHRTPHLWSHACVDWQPLAGAPTPQGAG